MIVLPNGFNVYPEDIENALRIAGIRDSVVLETEPGRIEAVVLGSATGPPGAGAVGAPGEPIPRRFATGSTPRSRPRTRRSARTSASRAGGCGPTRTSRGPTRYKIKRAQIAAWIATDRAADRSPDASPQFGTG